MRITVEFEVDGLGLVLKAAREALGMSLTVAGDRAGMSGSNFNRIENGKTETVPFLTLARAANAVELDLRDYIGDWIEFVPGIDLDAT